jgi:hypothetical protein
MRREIAALGRVAVLCALAAPGCTWDWDQFRARAGEDAAVPDGPAPVDAEGDAAPPVLPLGASANWVIDIDESCDGTTVDRQRWRTQYMRGNNPFSYFDWAGSWADDQNVTLSNGLCRIRVEERVSPQNNTKVIATAVLSSQSFIRPPAFIEVRMRGLRGTGLSTVAQLSSPAGYPPQLDIARIDGKSPTGPDVQFYYPTGSTTGSFKVTFPEPRADLSADFHVFGLEWRTTKMVVYRDGVRSPMEVPASVAQRTFDKGPLQVEITVHTGPGEVIAEKPVPPAVPAEVLIDYVRVWKER